MPSRWITRNPLNGEVLECTGSRKRGMARKCKCIKNCKTRKSYKPTAAEKRSALRKSSRVRKHLKEQQEVLRSIQKQLKSRKPYRVYKDERGYTCTQMKPRGAVRCVKPSSRA